jgi:uncharacterized protein (TIGR04255 family)
MTDNPAPIERIPERHYKQPPIVEALCEIYLAGSRWDLTVPGLFFERVREDYPQKAELAGVGIEVQLRPDQAETRSLPVDSRMRFMKADSSRMLQLTRDLLVVNQLRPYPRYEDWRQEVHRAINIYRELASPAGIDRIGVRYINRINLPGPLVRMEDYFRIYPELPQELGAAHGAFMLNLVLSAATPHQLQLTLGTAPAEQPGSMGFLLDIYDVAALGGRDAFGEVPGLLDQAHANIVHTFENTITAALRSRFGEITDE